MITISKMIKALDVLVGLDELDLLEERFVSNVSDKTGGGEIGGLLSDPDQMSIRRLYAKYCEN